MEGIETNLSHQRRPTLDILWKHAQRYALIALIFYLVFCFLAPMLTSWLIDFAQTSGTFMDTPGMMSNMVNLFFSPVSSLGFAIWLAAVSKSLAWNRALWFFVGLFFGVTGAVLFHSLAVLKALGEQKA